MMRLIWPFRDKQQDPPTYCDRCGGEIYEEIDRDCFGAILCNECKEELNRE